MHYLSRVLSAALFASVISLCSTGVQAQVLEGQQFFQLPPLNTVNSLPEGVPITLDAGDIDASVVTDIGALPLNDVVVMSIINEFIPGGNGFEGSGRVYSLVHTSGSDTRAFAIATPVDVPVDSSNPEQCYGVPSSVLILDLNGDDTNDLAFTSSCDIEDGFGSTGSVYGIAGSASDPFQVPGSLTVLGTQNDGQMLSPTELPGTLQLNLASADYDGDGLPDLAIYDADSAGPSDQIRALLNDGTLGPLPDELSTVTGPVTPPTQALGILVTPGDFDGNGVQDLAIAYLAESGNNSLFAYSGNGDGTFAATPLFSAIDIGAEFIPMGLTAGNFDDNAFSDFAVSFVNDSDGGSGIVIVLCSPGSPVTCTTNIIAAAETTLSGVVVAADFDSDGLDDLANISFPGAISSGPTAVVSSVDIRLNNGGGFDNAVDQSLILDATNFPNVSILQVVADDLDACGGPDIAFTGVTQGFAAAAGTNPVAEFQASVAFNPNEAPVANAGSPSNVTGGIQVGGAPGGQPTCSDPTDDLMVISWTVLSGNATFNDASSSNPIVTSASANAVVQVTCTDACGLSDSASVTLPANNFIQGSCGTSLTGTMSATFNATWLAIPALTGILAMLRRRRS